MLQGFQFNIFAKSGIKVVLDVYIGLPFGSLAVICRDKYLFGLKELNPPSDRTFAIDRIM